MCGITGVWKNDGGDMDGRFASRFAETLLRISRRRGSESSGLAVEDEAGIRFIKAARPIDRLLRTDVPRGFLRDLSIQAVHGLVGHSRLVTNGSQFRHVNNQPAVFHDLLSVHNGIVVETDKIFDELGETPQSDLDTEAFLAVFRNELDRNSEDPARACERALARLKGAGSFACLGRGCDGLVLASNNGSLFTVEIPSAGLRAFASERFIIEEAMRRSGIDAADYPVNQLALGRALWWRGGGKSSPDINDLSRVSDRSRTPSPPAHLRRDVDEAALYRGLDDAHGLKRCSRCILPETFPGIDFDADGVCSICREPEQPMEIDSEAFESGLAKHRSSNGKADCLVGLSGGRDSCYGLHVLKKELGMNPIAYTYDWGMVTDLARRNISRMCGELGIEHIVISANIRKKRENIRRNVEAWLRRPDLGMIPLFMAGDKQFYWFADQVRRQTGIDYFVFCAGNRYEETRFKTAYAGIRRGATASILKSLPASSILSMLGYYGRQFILNPAYFNRSIPDTAFAFYASYLMPDNYEYLFHHYRWDEDEVESVLFQQYDWERASDTPTTWRIGDGTAAFYNYIYYAVAGFTEFDTFRANQVRAGVMDRSDAISKVRAENGPRVESILWYLETIGTRASLNDVVRTVQGMTRLF